MISRVIWVLAIAVIAAVSIAAQLDRQSRVAPALSTAVPEPFRAFAQAHLARDALVAGDHDAALEHARVLVARRPVPAENLRLLAQAEIESGDAEAGVVTIQLSAQRGWRDPLAQETVLRFALAAGDEPEAARRYTALFLRNSTRDALLLETGATLFDRNDGPGTQTLLEIVEGSERWRTHFLRRGARVLPASTFAYIVSQALQNGAEFDCDVLQSSVRPIGIRDEATGTSFRAKVEEFCGRPQ